MTIRISRGALAALLAEVAAVPHEECCGLLLGMPGQRIDAILPATNVAADRRTRFEIDPAVLIAAHRAARGGGPEIVGCYHSHPGGDAAPSSDDAAQAEANGWIWMIAHGRDATAWRAVEAGGRHGRFEAVGMMVA